MKKTIHDQLDAIRAKVETNERLSAADGEFLLREDVGLHAVGELADAVRRRKNGAAVYYNLNVHLNPTNICLYRCPLCAYSCDPRDAKAYVMDRDAILARGAEAAEGGCTELHIVGGIHPDKPYAWCRDMLADLHRAYPRLLLKAWTAAEIAHFAKLTGWSFRAVLEDLVEVGLSSLPGGGAEIFAPEVRRRIAPRKADAETWLEVHRAAHQLGLRSTATMLYGHLENARHRIDHLLRLRALQDETAGFLTFIPLAFHPEGTALGEMLAAMRAEAEPQEDAPPCPALSREKKVVSGSNTTALEDLRMMAVARLMLDNVDHMKAYWISLGIGTAQTALAYGADDLDGTVRHERIHHDAGATAPKSLGVEQLRRLIVEAGREPVERDTLYRRVRRDGIRWRVEEEKIF